tara:strand:- start:2155 stop:2328 length:174 start_codon:yes stop_codon:yes gene_type:complete
MVEQKEQHFELIDKNKQKAYEEQREMRKECSDYVLNCSVFHLQTIYQLIKGLSERKG